MPVAVGVLTIVSSCGCVMLVDIFGGFTNYERI
jgi:hypothetical protein